MNAILKGIWKLVKNDYMQLVKSCNCLLNWVNYNSKSSSIELHNARINFRLLIGIFSHTVLKLRDLHSTHFVFQNKQGPPPHPYVPRNGTGRAGGKPPTARGHVKKVKGKKGKKGKKDQYDLIVNIDLVSVQYNSKVSYTRTKRFNNIR